MLKLRTKLAALVIAIQDDLDMAQAEGFLAGFDDALHEDCPYGNYAACPKCRCNTAHALVDHIIECIEVEGYKICEK